MIADSPFADMKGTGVRANKSREHFFTREVAEKVLAACPDPEWKLLFALSRYGGLRCPSEHLALCWSDVGWDLGRITVRSPKTEHHDGKEFRTIPLFPELRLELQKVADKVNLGSDTRANHHPLSRSQQQSQLPFAPSAPICKPPYGGMFFAVETTLLKGQRAKSMRI